ncbi:alpha/beta hydrolase family protein [Streptomyces sp. NPDC051561]|uniref:alpha/beta hydrolase family protein n=1 Tax=Streptomyces sp. NPDC051561 TaxID=3365658 RepID=UPI0037A91A85
MKQTRTVTASRPPTALRRTALRATAAVAVAVLAGVTAAPAIAATGPASVSAGRSAAPATGPAATSSAHTGRGTLISVTPVARLDRSAVLAFLAKGGVEADRSLVRHDIAAYRLIYRTVTPQGAPTTASGLLVLPQGGDRRLSLVSDTHGTMVHRDYAPSVADDFSRLSAALYASTGRAVAAPDYLGLGKGPGSHPYMDTRSAVTATVDMLRASGRATEKLGRNLNGDVHATGFSQGGQVAMAIGRELSGQGPSGREPSGGERHFRLKSLAPVSGPYDLLGTELPALYDGRVNPLSGIFYSTYFLTAQNKLHPLYKDPAEVFRKPYDKVAEQLFDTHHTEEDVARNLPGTLKELLTPRYYEEMRRPSGALLAAIKVNDGTCDWKPRAPVRLYTSSGDTDVPRGNARTCAADLARNGVKAPTVDQGQVDHFGTFKKSAPQIARWFNSLDPVR